MSKPENKAVDLKNTQNVIMPTDLWRQRYPVLSLAFDEARRRFGTLPGVCGFGIGRKFHESENCYSKNSSSNGGLCIMIFVDNKINSAELPRSHRIPSSITVQVPGKKVRCSVQLDVMAAGKPKLQAELHKHEWPTAGEMNVGRIFSFGYSLADEPNGVFERGEAELGTVGAIIKRGQKTFLAVTAAHVFINTCGEDLSAPQGDRKVGVQEKKWLRSPDRSFKPTTLGDSTLLMDAMCMAIIKDILPKRISWPPLFDYQLATYDDIQAAIYANEVGGFVWVERPGMPVEGLRLDLLAGLDEFRPWVCPDKRSEYGFVWPYRFLDEFTIGGDSGAGVFVPAHNKAAVRLLGFHFLCDEDSGRGYAVDARLFFNRTFRAALGKGYIFA